MFLQGIANFIDDLMGGFQLVGLAMLVGSIVWALSVLRVAATPGGSPTGTLTLAARVLRWGALLLAGAQALKILTKGLVLAATLGTLPLSDYASTVQFEAGSVRLLLALAAAAAAGWIAAAPHSLLRWRIGSAIAAAVVISGGWLVHAVGRFEERALLMQLTVLHQLAAAVWVGGVVQLLALWRAGRQEAALRAFWPEAVARFSPVGMVCVVVLVVTGVVLATDYVGSWQGLFGTGYGSLVAAKAVLLAVTLGFAALNFSAGRAWRRYRSPDATSGSPAAMARVPFYIEAETFLLVAVLFVAASLSSLPPAIDIPQASAQLHEVLGMFAPRLPSLVTPSHASLLAGEAERLAIVGRVASSAATDWSDYNHNVAGLFLVGMGAFALLSYLPRMAWARYWPLGFVMLGVFLFFRSDAETWPMGPIGFWESTFGNGEVLQHRLATLLCFGLGVIELRIRKAGRRESSDPRYAFAVLCALGGLLLVTHAHSPFELKTDYLIQSTHLVMGLLATMMAVGRWLELRLAEDRSLGWSRAAGLLSVSSMLLIGLVLVFYKEPLV
ncbi:MAG: copper resistance protein [Burkholderiales bacterium PBB1]|nr:MAG: copper resistance protein [Burkholderiales bacterium PBB1]